MQHCSALRISGICPDVLTPSCRKAQTHCASVASYACQYASQLDSNHTKFVNAKCHRNRHVTLATPGSQQPAHAEKKQPDFPEAKATDFIEPDSLTQSSRVYASPQSSAYQNVASNMQQKQKQGELDSSFWAHKPYWCQPWSILLTGTLFVAGARQLFHNNIVTGLAAIPILIWWYLFLVLVPANYRSFVEEE